MWNRTASRPNWAHLKSGRGLHLTKPLQLAPASFYIHEFSRLMKRVFFFYSSGTATYWLDKKFFGGAFPPPPAA